MPTENDGALALDARAVEASGIKLPGATPDGIAAQLLNIDGARGVIATIVHIAPGAEIPAHFHKNGSEAHYVLEGDLVDAGRPFDPGTYLTHAAGVVHGPHGSVDGCKVLTVQGAGGSASTSDFHLAEPAAAKPPAGPAPPDATPERGPPPPDMALEAVDTEAEPGSEGPGPTPDNPTNPTTG